MRSSMTRPLSTASAERSSTRGAANTMTIIVVILFNTLVIIIVILNICVIITRLLRPGQGQGQGQGQRLRRQGQGQGHGQGRGQGQGQGRGGCDGCHQQHQGVVEGKLWRAGKPLLWTTDNHPGDGCHRRHHVDGRPRPRRS